MAAEALGLEETEAMTGNRASDDGGRSSRGGEQRTNGRCFEDEVVDLVAGLIILFLQEREELRMKVGSVVWAKK